MHVERHATSTAGGLRIGIARSRYHEQVTALLLAGAIETYARAGGDESKLLVVDAPGTFEVTAMSRALVERADIDGVVALGCVIRGETSHDQYLSQAVAHGLTDLTLTTGKPIAFGILTCNTLHQARERAGGGQGNKGADAMSALLDTVHAVRAIATPVTPGARP